VVVEGVWRVGVLSCLLVPLNGTSGHSDDPVEFVKPFDSLNQRLRKRYDFTLGHVLTLVLPFEAVFFGPGAEG